MIVFTLTHIQSYVNCPTIVICEESTVGQCPEQLTPSNSISNAEKIDALTYHTERNARNSFLVKCLVGHGRKSSPLANRLHKPQPPEAKTVPTWQSSTIEFL